MTFDEYQTFTTSTAIFDPIDGLPYTTLGLVGEACEAAAKVQKIVEKTYSEFQKKYIEEQSEKVRDQMLGQMDNLRRLNSVLAEAGSLSLRAETLKKDIRSKKISMPPIKKPSQDECVELVKEIGDVLWYTTQASRVLDQKFSDVVAKNVEKLSSRKERGVLGGSGDNR